MSFQAPERKTQKRKWYKGRQEEIRHHLEQKEPSYNNWGCTDHAINFSLLRFISITLIIYVQNQLYRLMIATSDQLNKSEGPLQPNPALDIAFKDVVYTVETEDKTVDQPFLPCLKKTVPKELLKGVSGIFPAGKLTAIMGASGAGKTTLLNVIACRLPEQNLQGALTVNGQPYNVKNFGDFANYVMQQDIFIQTLTVQETLMFAANLKMTGSEREKENKVKQLAKEFKLQRCLDTLVGGEHIKGISGGEKKRTSIVFELITNPSVLALDEPTSGLDSLTSYIIIRYLKKAAEQEGKTIFMTIHQPNADIYELFDRLILIINGQFIYQGDADAAPEYFCQRFGLPFPEMTNPSDYIMSIMHPEIPANVKRYPAYFQAYQHYIAPRIQNQIDHQHGDPVIKRQVQVTLSTTLKTLVHRDLLNIFRNPLLVKFRVLQTLFTSVFTAGLFARFSEDYEDDLNWRALTGCLFELSIQAITNSLTPVELVFPSERMVFLKEEGAKLYKTIPYFVSRNIVEIPYSFIIPLITVLIYYWFVGLSHTAPQFFIFYLITYLLTLNGTSLGLMLGSMITDAKSISTVTSILMMPLFLLSGFFKNSGNIPPWIGWIQYLSPVKYGFSAYVQNEVMFVENSNIDELNFDTGLWLNIILLSVLAVVYRLVSLFFLWKMRKRLQ